MYAQTTFLWPRNIVSSFCNRFVWQCVHSAQQQQQYNREHTIAASRRRCTAHFVLSVCMLFCYFRVVVVVALLFVVVVVVVVIELVCSVLVCKDSKSICVLPVHSMLAIFPISLFCTLFGVVFAAHILLKRCPVVVLNYPLNIFTVAMLCALIHHSLKRMREREIKRERMREHAIGHGDACSLCPFKIPILLLLTFLCWVPLLPILSLTLSLFLSCSVFITHLS